MRLASAIKALIIAAVMTTAGCASYEDYLYSLPVTERTRNGEAIAVVSAVFGIDYRIPEIRWIVQDEPLPTVYGGRASGLTYDCVSWIWWSPAQGPDPEHSPRFSDTSLAHEIAHCALWLYLGDGDGGHVNVEWWGTKDQGRRGGLVRVAMDELAKRGM